MSRLHVHKQKLEDASGHHCYLLIIGVLVISEVLILTFSCVRLPRFVVLLAALLFSCMILCSCYRLHH